MSRGRRAQPDELKALKGNPGKRKLALEGVGKASATAKPVSVQVPEFLTEPREIDIFNRIVGDYLQRRVARAPDLNAYARWAHYLHRWIGCKEYFDERNAEGKKVRTTWYKVESNHGTRLARHPVYKDLLDMEKILQSLEDRLGLNPISRQSIIKGLSAMPAALGGLFGDEPAADEKPADAPDVPTTEEVVAAASPLGFLQAAGGKPH